MQRSLAFLHENYKIQQQRVILSAKKQGGNLFESYYNAREHWALSQRWTTTSLKQIKVRCASCLGDMNTTLTNDQFGAFFDENQGCIQYGKVIFSFILGRK